eukprot:8019533-Ditylum_brightwellii.AAC.1
MGFGCLQHLMTPYHFEGESELQSPNIPSNSPAFSLRNGKWSSTQGNRSSQDSAYQGVLKFGDLQPSDKVSCNQYKSSVPGHCSHTFGKEKEFD